MSRPKNEKGYKIQWRDGWARALFYLPTGKVTKSLHVHDPLGTAETTASNPAAIQARVKAEAALAEYARQGLMPKISKTELFRDAVERVGELRKSDGVAGHKDALSRLQRFAFDALGDLEVTKIKSTDIMRVLDAVKAAGRSRMTVAHVLNDVRAIFKQLRREGVIELDPAEAALMPRFPTTVRRERAVLADDEIARYLGWEHPDPRFAHAVRERQTMIALSRVVGGMRRGDLHALRWEAFEPEFVALWVPRQKTRRPQRLHVAEMIRPIVRDWWERAGRPQEGLIFATMAGERVGEQRKGVNHARALRRDLRRCFGLETWDGEKYVPAERQMTARERELFTNTATTKRLDFHSGRRAYVQALADAGLSAQQASALAGHASLSAHARYLASSGVERALPEAALPRFGSTPDRLLAETSMIPAEMTAGRRRANSTARSQTSWLKRRGSWRRWSR